MDYHKALFDTCREYLRDAPFPDHCRGPIEGWIRNRDLGRLTSVSQAFRGYLETPGHWRTALQIEAFFKKNVMFETDSAAAKAVESFHAAEASCKETNERLSSLFLDSDHPTHQKIETMRRFVASVLGPCRRFLDQIPDLIRLTSGATATEPRKHSRPDRKVRSRVPSTPYAYQLLDTLYKYRGLSARPKFLLGNVNRVEFVPKNWKTHRTIACEPTGNLPFQLAFDSYCKMRMKRTIGIDLSSQLFNQEAARQASIDGLRATIDLSAASDSLSLALVQWVFPEDWQSFLMGTRSVAGRLPDGGYVVYQKYASMGNGTTFPLETLVFAAAAHAVGCVNPLVYGDDIIVESDKADELIALLAVIGFRTNVEKTFTTGPFRESCGMNACHGVEVTPLYFQEEPRSSASAAMWVNYLGKLAPSSQGTMFKLAVHLANKFKLPFVPYDSDPKSGMQDPLSGIWSPVSLVYQSGNVRKRKRLWRPEYRAIVSVPRHREHRANSRSFFLWLLDTRRRELSYEIDDAVVRATVQSAANRRVRKWTRLVPPVEVPVHLYWWPVEIFLSMRRTSQ